MEMKDIKRIIELMQGNDLTEFKMEEEGFKINIKRSNGKESVSVTPAQMASMMMPQQAAAPVAPPPSAAPAPAAEPEEDLLEIKSPIVGTFYRSASPESDPFVQVGDSVEDESTVCIIEAMKVMNEIKADVKGVVKKIMVENATPVQYGQVLFLVKAQ